MAWIEPSPKTLPNHRGPWYVRFREGGLKQRSGPWWSLPEARDEKAKRHTQEREVRKSIRGHAAPDTELKGLFKNYLVEEVSAGTLRQSTAHQKDRMLAPYLDRFHSLRDLTGTFGTKDWGAPPQQLKTALLTEPSPASQKRAKRHNNDETYLKPYSSTTVSIILRALQTFLEWCKTKKYIPANPMEDFGMPKSKERQDILQGGKKDVEIVIAAAPTPIFRLFLTFQIYQGLRKGMTRQVEGHEIRDGMWTVPGHKAKVDNDITIPLHPRVRALLSEMFPKALPRGPIFGADFSNGKIGELWRQTRARANLPYHITIHGLRRTWATDFMKHTQNLKAMMTAGHWLDAKTAMKYQHIQAKWLKGQIETFDFEG